MTLLPAVVTRPLIDAFADAISPATASPPRADRTAGPGGLVESDLADGVPARFVLDARRSLVLAVPLGVARPLLDADPLTVVVEDAAIARPDPAERVPPDVPRARLTLVSDGRIGGSTPVVPGVEVLLGDGDRAVVAVVVDRLRITAGALRGPGRFDCRLLLRWTDLTAAGDGGPPAVPGDPALALLGRAGA